MSARRYRVVFTPVGWQVIDSVVAGDPIGEYGSGPSEYRRAAEHAAELNAGTRERSRARAARRAATRLSLATTALIDLRELTEPGQHAAWIDKQIGALIGARAVLEEDVAPHHTPTKDLA